MLYVCLPVHNESATVGVLLWRLRTVLQEAGRDYEVVVYDDASTDATAEVLAPYARVMPLTVLGGPATAPRGRTAATAALLGHVAAHSRYPRRDACALLQGDFTDRPEELPAFLAALDGGADVVVGRRPPEPGQPPGERRLRRLAPWVLRPLVRVEAVDDLLAGPRLLRVAVVRDLVRDRGDRPLLAWDGWAGQAELVVAAVSHARRVAVIDTPGRYDVRTRPSRLDWAMELRSLARYAWQARGTRARLRPAHRPPAGGAAPAPSTAASEAAVGEPNEAPNVAAVAASSAGRAARPRRGKRGGVAPTSAPAGTPARVTPPAAPAPEASPSDRSPARTERPRAKNRAARAAGPAATLDADSAPAPTSSDTPPATRAADVGLPHAPLVRADVAPAAEATADVAADATAPARRRKRRSKRRSAAGEPRGADASDPATAVEPPTTDPRAATTDGTTTDGAAPVDSADRPLGTAGELDAQEATPEGAVGAPGRAKRKRRRRSRGRSAEGTAGVEEDAAATRPTDGAPSEGGDSTRAPAPPDHSLSPQ